MGLIAERTAGDIIRLPANALVNPWNRNFIPRWLLVPGGVSGALKKQTGPAPWRELAQHGLLDLGEAVTTSAGELTNVTAIIHVAGLTMGWKATPRSVQLSVANAVSEARKQGFTSITMPLIGAGHGGLGDDTARDLIHTALDSADAGADLRVQIVEYRHG